MENQSFILDQEESLLDTNIDRQNVISLGMFIFLNVITLGLYEIWWIYKAWRFFQQKEKSNLMPAVRTILSLFLLISLFQRVLTFAKEKGYTKSYSSVLLVIAGLAFNFLSYVPSAFGLISIFSFVFFIPPFLALNYAKRNSKEVVVYEQTSISARQIILIIAGSIFWILLIVGLSNGENF
jgi:hypothetical protein